MAMRDIQCGAVIALLLVGAAGCGGSGDVDDARAAADSFMTLRRQGDAEAVLGRYSPIFFEEQNRADWRATLASHRDRLGALREWTITKAVRAGADDAVPGASVAIHLTCRYERGQTTEMLILFRPEHSRTWEIVGHTISLPVDADR